MKGFIILVLALIQFKLMAQSPGTRNLHFIEDLLENVQSQQLALCSRSTLRELGLKRKLAQSRHFMVEILVLALKNNQINYEPTMEELRNSTGHEVYDSYYQNLLDHSSFRAAFSQNGARSRSANNIYALLDSYPELQHAYSPELTELIQEFYRTRRNAGMGLSRLYQLEKMINNQLAINFLYDLSEQELRLFLRDHSLIRTVLGSFLVNIQAECGC